MMGANTFELFATIPTRCILGEGPVWDFRTGILWLTDIQRSELLALDWESRDLERYALPERLGSFGLTERSGRFVCAFASGFALHEPKNGATRWLHRTTPESSGIRMNDGRVDRQGRFWAGSMVEDENVAPARHGALYRLDRADGSAPIRLIEGVSISNSVCFSPAGETLYFADSPSREIVRYDLLKDGSIANRRVFASLADNANPDGSDVDAEGRVWNAEWGSGRVTAYEPDGSIFARLELPVSQATCVAFGGRELDMLFVTSAREGLSAAGLESQPHAGDVLVYRTRVRGLPAPLFGGCDD